MSHHAFQVALPFLQNMLMPVATVLVDSVFNMACHILKFKNYPFLGNNMAFSMILPSG